MCTGDIRKRHSGPLLPLRWSLSFKSMACDVSFDIFSVFSSMIRFYVHCMTCDSSMSLYEQQRESGCSKHRDDWYLYFVVYWNLGVHIGKSRLPLNNL
jgi:hypothetical protein